MVDLNVANILGRCIQKYKHAHDINEFANRFSTNCNSNIISSISTYVEHLCGDLIFSADPKGEVNLNILLNKMFGAYGDMVSCFKVSMQAAVDQVSGTIIKYENIVIQNNGKITMSFDLVNISALKNDLISWHNVSQEFQEFSQMDSETLSNDWSDHFTVFEDGLSSLSSVEREMNSQIETVEKKIREDERLELAKKSLKNAKIGLRVAIVAGILGIIFKEEAKNFFFVFIPSLFPGS